MTPPVDDPPLHIVLYEPEIPQNTGNAGRLCVAIGAVLHVVRPIPFQMDEKAVRRAGLDYWHLVDLRRHLDMPHFAREIPPERWLLFSALAEKSYVEAPFEPGCALIFGKESVGLPEDLVAQHADRVYGIPTSGGVRSLNLATAAGIVLYEGLRATGSLAGAVRR